MISIKICAIGNSFSEDAMTYLAEIARSSGMKDIVLGILYIGGASLQQHYENMLSDAHNYDYWKNTDNHWEMINSKSLEFGMMDENWDIITFQQASGLSGIKESYTPYLDELIKYVKKLNKEPLLIMWHMTWAYAKSSTHGGFSYYQSDQNVMYQSMMDTTKEIIESNPEFSLIIPAGTAIQNMREKYKDDELTRDGFHLNELGRYIAALTWFGAITGLNVNQTNYRPKAITRRQAELAYKAVNEALLNQLQPEKKDII